MKVKIAIAIASGLFTLGTCAHAADVKPIRFILVGDSTMARSSGYGNAFCERVVIEDTCINLARAGRSSASFRREGRWDEVEGLLKGSAAYRATYVLIQFGHNDQPGKPGHSTDLAREFPANMARYAREVTALGGIPVLVTPLTRRTFVDGVLENSLRPWAETTLKVARDEHVPAVDLNALSHDAVAAMGQDQADTLAVAPRPAGYVGPAVLPGSPAPAQPSVAPMTPSTAPNGFDRTHLGRKGADLFATIVEQGVVKAVPALAKAFKTPE